MPKLPPVKLWEGWGRRYAGDIDTHMLHLEIVDIDTIEGRAMPLHGSPRKQRGLLSFLGQSKKGGLPSFFCSPTVVARRYNFPQRNNKCSLASIKVQKMMPRLTVAEELIESPLTFEVCRQYLVQILEHHQAEHKIIADQVSTFSEHFLICL